MKKFIAICTFGLFCFFGLSAQDTFLKIEGLGGGSTDQEHKDWINLVAISHAMSKPAAPAVAGTTRRRGSPTVEDLVCVKELDKSSPKIAEALVKGTVIPKVEVHLTKTVSTGVRVTYYAYELTNVMVSSYEISHEGDQPVEHVSFSFSEIKTTYTDYDGFGRKKGSVEFSWNVEAGK